MPANVATVVKKHRVKVAGPRPLGRPAAGGETAAAAAGRPEVRIAHTDADRAVLEVRCGCGRVIHVECRWETPGAGGAPDAPDAAGDPPAEQGD